MLTCAFFLRGICSRDNCPYLHVSVGRDANVCPDFLKGFCPKEEKVSNNCVLKYLVLFSSGGDGGGGK